jgi:hypothetical protein
VVICDYEKRLLVNKEIVKFALAVPKPSNLKESAMPNETSHKAALSPHTTYFPPILSSVRDVQEPYKQARKFAWFTRFTPLTATQAVKAMSHLVLVNFEGSR